MEMMTTRSGRRCLELGSRLGRLGGLAVGAEGDGLAWMLARCVGCGASLAGGQVFFHDGSAPASGVWLADRYDLSAALFLLEREGGAALYLTDARNRPLAEEELPPPAGWADAPGSWDRLACTDSACAARRVGDSRVEGLTVAVEEGAGQKLLRMALERLGCEVLRHPRPGAPLLRADELGFFLTVREGARVTSLEGSDAAAAAVRWCLDRAAGQKLGIPAFGQEQGRRI